MPGTLLGKSTTSDSPADTETSLLEKEMHSACAHAAKDAALKEKLISPWFECREAQGRLGLDRHRRLFPSFGCSPLQSQWLQSDNVCLMQREQIIHEKHHC